MVVCLLVKPTVDRRAPGSLWSSSGGTWPHGSPRVGSPPPGWTTHTLHTRYIQHALHTTWNNTCYIQHTRYNIHVHHSMYYLKCSLTIEMVSEHVHVIDTLQTHYRHVSYTIYNTDMLRTTPTRYIHISYITDMLQTTLTRHRHVKNTLQTTPTRYRHRQTRYKQVPFTLHTINQFVFLWSVGVCWLQQLSRELH